MDGLPEQQRQENFSLAYLRAMAAACGFCVQRPEDDYDSIDLTVSARGKVSHGGKKGAATSPCLALQVKCTYAQEPRDGQLKYPISIKNYNDLRDPQRIIPAILVVLHVPKTWSTRLRWSDKSLILKKVAFWRCLRGEPAVNNSDNVTVTMSELLSPEALARLMFLAAQGEL